VIDPVVAEDLAVIRGCVAKVDALLPTVPAGEARDLLLDLRLDLAERVAAVEALAAELEALDG
jgi:hypothetical protein